MKDGVWEKFFHTLSSDADMENLSIDSTMAKAHQSTNGGFKKGQKNPSEEPVED
jgi:transposase